MESEMALVTMMMMTTTTTIKLVDCSYVERDDGFTAITSFGTGR